MAKEIETPAWLYDWIEESLRDNLSEDYKSGISAIGFTEEAEKDGLTYLIEVDARAEMHHTYYGDTPDEYDADVFDARVNVDVYNEDGDEIGYCAPDASLFEKNYSL